MTIFHVTEKSSIFAYRRYAKIEAKDLSSAKRMASRGKVFQKTILVIEDEYGNRLSVKDGGKWKDDRWEPELDLLLIDELDRWEPELDRWEPELDNY